MSIAEAMWRFVNGWAEKPVEIGLDVLGKGSPAMMLQQLSGTVVEKRFVDGRFIGRWPFAVCVRARPDAAVGRINAVSTIQRLYEWMRAQALPDLGDGRTGLAIVMASLPAKAGAYPDGTEDYEAVFQLQYKEDKGV